MKLNRLVVLAIVLPLGGCWRGYSQGERVGVPFKYSHKGMFCKTWEGSVNLGGMRQETSSDGKSTTMVPNTWNFTVADENSAKFNPIITDAIEKGATLKMTYDQELIPICDSDEGYFVTNVEIIRQQR